MAATAPALAPATASARRQATAPRLDVIVAVARLMERALAVQAARDVKVQTGQTLRG